MPRNALAIMLLLPTVAISSAVPTCPSSHPHVCLNPSSVNNMGDDSCQTCSPEYFQGPCCEREGHCICDAYVGPCDPVCVSEDGARA